MLLLDDTICAIATPPGEGSVAIVRLSGASAFAVADRIFHLRTGKPSSCASHTIHYGAVVDPASGEAVDDALLLVFRAPNSYTGEDVVEVSCHGGSVTPHRVLALALAHGARAALPGEFTQRAFLHGRMDLAQAEAVCDQIRAGTEAARRVAARQRDGALSRAVSALRERSLLLLASIEAAIDFSEDVGEVDHVSVHAELAGIEAEIARLIAEGERGRVFREGARVVLVGRPNVGKSSLFNALLRDSRAIVTPVPGTTRDAIEATADIRGLPVTLVDTAGLRDTVDPVEQIGVARTRAEMGSASVILLVGDATSGWTPQDSAASPLASLRVLNKADLVLPGAPATDGDSLCVSALTGAGIDALEAAIREALIGSEGSSGDAPIVSNVRHVRALSAAHRSVDAALASCDAALPADLLAVDVRGALDALGEVTGETATEEVIDTIFRRFCVGK